MSDTHASTLLAFARCAAATASLSGATSHRRFVSGPWGCLALLPSQLHSLSVHVKTSFFRKHVYRGCRGAGRGCRGKKKQGRSSVSTTCEVQQLPRPSAAFECLPSPPTTVTLAVRGRRVFRGPRSSRFCQRFLSVFLPPRHMQIEENA